MAERRKPSFHRQPADPRKDIEYEAGEHPRHKRRGCCYFAADHFKPAVQRQEPSSVIYFVTETREEKGGTEMKVTSALANKMIRQLEEEREYWNR